MGRRIMRGSTTWPTQPRLHVRPECSSVECSHPPPGISRFLLRPPQPLFAARTIMQLVGMVAQAPTFDRTAKAAYLAALRAQLPSERSGLLAAVWA